MLTFNYKQKKLMDFGVSVIAIGLCIFFPLIALISLSSPVWVVIVGACVIGLLTFSLSLFITHTKRGSYFTDPHVHTMSDALEQENTVTLKTQKSPLAKKHLFFPEAPPMKKMGIIGAERTEPSDVRRFDAFCTRKSMVWMGHQTKFNLPDIFLLSSRSFNTIIDKYLTKLDEYFTSYVKEQWPEIAFLDVFMIDRCVRNFFIPTDEMLDTLRKKLLQKSIDGRQIAQYVYTDFRYAVFILLIERFLERLNSGGALIIDTECFDDDLLQLLNQYFSEPADTLKDADLIPPDQKFSFAYFKIFKGFKPECLNKQEPLSIQYLRSCLPIQEADVLRVAP